VILFGVEIRHPEAPAWRILREALAAAQTAGSVAILPAGNRPAGPACAWPEALVVGSVTWRGDRSAFSPFKSRLSNGVYAPGENIPGAIAGGGFGLRSGSSFAATLAAGTLALAAAQRPNAPVIHAAAHLFPPPHRVLNGAALFIHQSHERSGHHAASLS
jgi:subtilisin family serine protease